MDALEELKTRSLNRGDFQNRGFVKADKEHAVDIEKASRLIQYMKPTGALEMGRFTHAIESQIYSLQDKYNTKIFGKGGNLHEMGEDLNRKREQFQNPVYLLLDASKFDAHVSTEMLQMVAEWYLNLVEDPKQRSYVAWLWKHTFTNYGTTKNGIRYKTNGTRMSGHMDTGLGNSLIMYSMLVSYLKIVGITKYSLSVNGDDSVIIIEKPDVGRASDLSCFKSFGFKMKFEMTDDFSKMDYCQTRPVNTKYGWMLARSPERILARVGFSVNKFCKKKIRDYLYSLGKGEEAINFGLPIGYALGQALVQSTPGGKMLALNRKRYISYTRQKFWNTGLVAEVDQVARMSYQEAWDITVEDQIALEQSFKIIMKPEVSEKQKMEMEAIIMSNLVIPG